jgi:hypothetical protein
MGTLFCQESARVSSSLVYNLSPLGKIWADLAAAPVCADTTGGGDCPPREDRK